ncbi:MAG: DNA adenine methylase [Phycisphaerales bacterium JB043]
MPTDLFGQQIATSYRRPKGSLLKWIGNKYKMAEQIASYFPEEFGTLYEVFLGSGSVIATVAPSKGVGSDSFEPLMQIWTTLHSQPEELKRWYSDRWNYVMSGDKRERYEEIKASYNAQANGPDFLFLTRSCYGGVIRFRKRDGYMSTPVGVHNPMLPDSFALRVDEWHERLQGTDFVHADYLDVMSMASDGDVVYCDPPYSHSQAILYGAQEFSLEKLLDAIDSCKARGVRVALSIDGKKKSGLMNCNLPIPEGLFEREVFIEVGRSMLRRFQMDGQTLESEVVTDRLLLTY